MDQFYFNLENANFTNRKPKFAKKVWSQNFNFFWVLGIKVGYFLFQRSKRSRMTHHSAFHPIWAKFSILTLTTANFRMKSPKFPKKVCLQKPNFLSFSEKSGQRCPPHLTMISSITQSDQRNSLIWKSYRQFKFCAQELFWELYPLIWCFAPRSYILLFTSMGAHC